MPLREWWTALVCEGCENRGTVGKEKGIAHIEENDSPFRHGTILPKVAPP